MKAHRGPYVTAAPWHTSFQHAQYGALDTYVRAAAWLRPCLTVADWGGSTGCFRDFLPPTTHYMNIDGTRQVMTSQILADLATYRGPSDGILLRHVLDMTPEWAAVLRNAVASFRRRMVVVTFTPDAAATFQRRMKSGWPLWHFNPDELRAIMAPYLNHDEAVRTTHPERVYYLLRKT